MQLIQFAVGPPVLVVATVVAAVVLSPTHASVLAQQGTTPTTAAASLIPAPPLAIGDADSNSPAVWELVNGRPRLHLFTSVNGWPTRHVGTQLSAMPEKAPIVFATAAPPHGVWFEAIVPDVDGTWYGYYHNERPAEVCNTDRAIPRIGAARSTDFGATWHDLGVIFESPPGWEDCESTNEYFVGGVGDFSAVLDQDHQDLYFFFTQYGDRERTQGVAVGRLAWADRDEPQGKFSVWWRGTTWAPTRRLVGMSGSVRYIYPVGVPIYPVAAGWHAGPRVDAFWGPSVHWNTYLQKYVMLLNRAEDMSWRQEGIYIAYADRLGDPTAWSTPKRLIAGGSWYPQVIGTESGTGSDRIAGQRARFFMGGLSHYLIQFDR